MGAADVVSLGVVAVLALAHTLAPLLRFVSYTPRSWLLSAAGGVSVAYVVVHLLPEVAEAQASVEDATTGVLAGLERHAYVVMLLGLAVFYGLERAAVISRHQDDDGDAEAATQVGTFWLSMGSFALYNAIVGYLVVRRAEDGGAVELTTFAAALAVHFVVNDLGLRWHHRRRYDHVGRPLLVGALLAGWILGVTTTLSEPAVGLAVAFLAGGIILNVMKEELPESSESRFRPFAAGAVVYAALLLLA